MSKKLLDGLDEESRRFVLEVRTSIGSLRTAVDYVLREVGESRVYDDHVHKGDIKYKDNKK